MHSSLWTRYRSRVPNRLDCHAHNAHAHVTILRYCQCSVKNKTYLGGKKMQLTFYWSLASSWNTLCIRHSIEFTGNGLHNAFVETALNIVKSAFKRLSWSPTKNCLFFSYQETRPHNFKIQIAAMLPFWSQILTPFLIYLKVPSSPWKTPDGKREHMQMLRTQDTQNAFSLGFRICPQ